MDTNVRLNYCNFVKCCKCIMVSIFEIQDVMFAKLVPFNSKSIAKISFDFTITSEESETLLLT